nr:LOG family protein [Anaerolineae bacterium]
MSQPVVSVFGGKAPKPGDPVYQQAETLGGLLASAGYAVMTGGYDGVMDAISCGAKAKGGHTIGVTVSLFDNLGHARSLYVDEFITYDSLSERMLHVIKRCQAVIALPGGIGTLAEVFVAWNLIQAGEVPRIPLILLGETWHDIVGVIYGTGRYIREDTMHLIRVVRTPEQAVTLLNEWG